MLTRKALLNGFQLIIDQLARILVNFFLTPVLVMHLGGAGFGIWQVIQKTTLQLATLDGRAPEVLKWIIASQQNEQDALKKQRAFGGAIVSFVGFLPLLLSVFGLYMVFSGQFIDIESGQQHDVRYTILMMAISSIVLVIAMLFEASIRGMNEAYRLLGIQALVLVAGGVLSAIAVIQGYGLKGLAAVQIVVSIMFLVGYYYIARKHIDWLGVSRPAVADIRQTLGRCGWYTLWAFISGWLFAGDIIVLGIFVDADVVSQYVLTMFLPQIITVLVLTAVASILPGLAGIIGSGDYLKAQKLRQESLLYSWWISIAVCAAIISFNYSLVSLWVGTEHYAGHEINLLIVICVLQLVFIRHDANILNLALDIRTKVYLGLVSILTSLVLMILLVPDYSLVGLCVSLLAGRLVLQIRYPVIINKFIEVKSRPGLPIRKSIVTFLLFYLSWQLSFYVEITEWWKLFAYSAGYGLVCFLIVYAIGMTKSDRSVITNRFSLVLSILK